ncbi:MAG: hypothetical protein IPN76_20980 [Saprospiraceae bacterium]|nr:hypothetical protein [Saprospiraceae bacterium]
MTSLPFCTKKQKGLAAEIDMSVCMEELAFKKANGSFVVNSNLAGKLNMDIESGNIKFEPFPLAINEQVFVFGGNYDTKKQQLTKLVLENNNTVWSQCMPLLPLDLQEKLAPYYIEKPYYTKTTISSYFKPDEPILVDIDFPNGGGKHGGGKGFPVRAAHVGRAVYQPII